ncbi:hypothetical protein EWE75_22595 [Sphingomonas populi]|uniref:Uncharacterized protein n=1 Tax=Sphingomonas populi TaxID=2484750 RepID=A0A4Q6XSU0_9SPHN|nr:hypothetical protein [Sphingomonas populi]RZF60544.1 hypothetical protein EWE75_22595 [Sphingomonas populi]
MTDYSALQQHHNGPLSEEAINFLHEVRLKYRWTYKVLGERLGISGGFAHNILNKNGNITTSTVMPKIAAGVERLKGGDTTAASEGVEDVGADTMLEHVFNLRPGLKVTFMLPADLTEKEGEKLALFMRSLGN